MKELTPRSKQTLRLILAEKGYQNIKIDDFGNVIEVRTKPRLIAKLFGIKESGKIVTSITELASKAMGLEYNPNEVVRSLAEKWVKEEM